MTPNILRFNPRHSPAVWLTRVEAPAGWMVLAADHGWIHGDYQSAAADAAWLSENLGFVLRGNQTERPSW
jgi:hypothetical protein